MILAVTSACAIVVRNLVMKFTKNELSTNIFVLNYFLPCCFVLFCLLWLLHSCMCLFRILFFTFSFNCGVILFYYITLLYKRWYQLHCPHSSLLESPRVPKFPSWLDTWVKIYPQKSYPTGWAVYMILFQENMNWDTEKMDIGPWPMFYCGWVEVYKHLLLPFKDAPTLP